MKITWSQTEITCVTWPSHVPFADGLLEGTKLLTFVWNVPTKGVPFPKCPSRAQKIHLEFAHWYSVSLVTTVNKAVLHLWTLVCIIQRQDENKKYHLNISKDRTFPSDKHSYKLLPLMFSISTDLNHHIYESIFHWLEVNRYIPTQSYYSEPCLSRYRQHLGSLCCDCRWLKEISSRDIHSWNPSSLWRKTSRTKPPTSTCAPPSLRNVSGCSSASLYLSLGLKLASFVLVLI